MPAEDEVKILATLSFLLLASCAVKRDTSRVEYIQHTPTAWRTTPGGHRRDAGPFDCVAKGYATEDDLDKAVDDGYSKFVALFPELAAKLKEHQVTLNDDYAMWVPGTDIFTSGSERSGSSVIGVCIWSRGEGPAAPNDKFISRPPGRYFEVDYPMWRWTEKPLCPAIPHELLHSVIVDGDHKSPLWSRIK